MSIRLKAEPIYTTDAKMLWRRKIWTALERRAGVPLNDVALMPGKGDDEVRVALSIGVKESGIRLIDHNAAVVATHRRARPGIGGTYGVTVARAFERMAADGVRLDAVHLDFCACVSGKILEEVRHVAASRVLRREGSVSVTVLRGREIGDVGRRITEAGEFMEWCGHLMDHERDLGWDGGLGGVGFKGTDVARIDALRDALNRGSGCDAWDNDSWSPTDAGAYHSAAGTQTMLWAVFTRDSDEGMGVSDGWQWANGTTPPYNNRWPNSVDEIRKSERGVEQWCKLVGSHPGSWWSFRLRHVTLEELVTMSRGELMGLYMVGPKSIDECVADVEVLRAAWPD